MAISLTTNKRFPGSSETGSDRAQFTFEIRKRYSFRKENVRISGGNAVLIFKEESTTSQERLSLRVSLIRAKRDWIHLCVFRIFLIPPHRDKGLTHF